MLIRYMLKARATHPAFTYHDLDILRAGLARNAERQISSLLLRSNREYFQVLEGPESEVRDLVAKIARDPRVFAFEELLSHPIRQRQFDHAPMDIHMLGQDDHALHRRLSQLDANAPDALKLSVLREVATLLHGKMAAVA